MDSGRAGTAAGFETTVFLCYFNEMPDPRQRGKVTYRLDESLSLALLATLAGAEGFTDIARFGRKKLSLLRRFPPFADGTPGHDHPGDIFASLDAEAFRGCFVAWVGALTQAPLDVIAIDGKTSRRSGRRGGKDAIHMVSAFAGRQRLVLARSKVNEKSNEILAIPAPLDMLSIEGAIVTIDPMGCRRDIARRIVDKKADYVLALMGNQGTLRDDVELFATEQKSTGFADTTIGVDQTVEGDHGRIETWRVTVIHDVVWLQERHRWPGLKGVVVVVEATRQIGPKTERETRFYLTSSNPRADNLGAIVRDHWAIENGLRWVMDMTFPM
jgi:predicted transposase YbfD/YdcC